MALVGADVEQMRTLARTLTRAAEQLDGMSREVTGRLSAAPWSGPDADRYRSQWHGESLAMMRGVASALRAAAATVDRNAAEQGHASVANGFGGGPSVAFVGGGGSDSDNPLTDALGKLLGVGGIANDIAKLGGKGFDGVTGGVISGSGVVTSLTTLVQGISGGDSLQTGDGVIGLGGAALGRIHPALGVAASGAQFYGGMTLPTSSSDIDGVFDMGAHHMFGKGIDQLTDGQHDALNHRYDGAWGVANMISDSMDSKAAAAGKFIAGLFGR